MTKLTNRPGKGFMPWKVGDGEDAVDTVCWAARIVNFPIGNAAA